jgi:hypothetical protein
LPTKFRQHLLQLEVHRIELTTLADQVPPTLVAATHTLMDGSTFSFSAAEQRQRAALLLEDGNIYAAFASWCDRNPARGWLLGWQASNLQPLANNILTNKLPASSSNKLSSIWMSGYGVSAIAGHLYFATGNSPDHEYEATADLSESVVKVSAGLGHVLDFFTPSSVVSLDTRDVDLGSGGVLILPDQPGNVPHMAAAAGKEGMLYLLNRVDLGGFGLVANHVLGQYFIGTCFCGQSYYLNKIVSSGGDQIGVWRVDTSPSPGLTKIQSSVPLGISGEGGFFTSISSNGAENAIIWAVSNTHNDAPAPLPSSPSCVFPFQQTNVPCLFAFQPIDGNPQLRLLFSGAAGNWQVPRPVDAVDATNSNTVPVVANGHVYVTSYRELDIFGFGQPVSESETVSALAAQPEVVTTQLQKSKLGIITKVDGSRFTLKTAAGAEIQIDAGEALKEGIAPQLAAGQAVSVYGTVDASGVMHAEVIKHVHVHKKL